MNQLEKYTDILIYTRIPKDEYTESLSNSIHLAFCEGDGNFQSLNQNYGILFTLADINQENVIQEKGLRNPYIFRTPQGSFGITAIRIDKEGKEDEASKGHILVWTSEDLIHFNSLGLVKLHEDRLVKDAVCNYNPSINAYEILWQDNTGKNYRNVWKDLAKPDGISLPETWNGFQKEEIPEYLPDINPGNIIRVDWETGKMIKNNWIPLNNTEVKVPDSVSITSREQLQTVKAEAVYSDGSTALKQVEWDDTSIDYLKPGTYKVKGQVKQKTYQFPLAIGYADPVILPWNNKYYFLATNDNVNDIGMYAREGNTVEELFQVGYKESIILNIDEERDFIQTFWAPEFHLIGDDLYILFAVGGKIWGPQCHMMRLKKGGNIMIAEDWEEPVRVKRQDGSYLTQDGITLDMTYFKADGTSCVAWSYRKGIGTPHDTGSMIYIATVNEKNPEVLTSEPVLLTRPLYGWENIQGTINNEGPYAMVTDDMVYITYSGGAACGYTYALGLLSIPRGSDYLDACTWKKAGTPVLSYYSINGIYGPGHNSFFTDYDGDVMIMYHVEDKIATFDTRCSTMHRVHFNKNNAPIFHMSKERDLNPALAEVELQAVIL